MSLIKIAVRDTGDKKPTRYYSSRQEKEVASKLKGKVTPNSGATPWIKGDVLLENFLLEMKTQTKSKETFTLHKEWFSKNDKECLLMGKPYSAVVFNFGPDEKNYYIIDEELFETLTQKVQK